jgi:hypothetical protein
MKPIYIGPSWAVRSFDTPDDTDTEITSIAKELELDVINLSSLGHSNRMLLQKLKSYLKQNPQAKSNPIIWFYSEPFIDAWWYEDCPEETFIQSPDWYELRSSTNKKILKEIANLNHPIALIGAHSDIVDCDHSNIEVIHPSWQKFLASTCDVELDCGWGAEIAHRIISNNPGIKPSYGIVDAVTDTFNSWHRLEMNHLFQICHPNILGNQLFAKEIKDSLFGWLSKYQSNSD